MFYNSSTLIDAVKRKAAIPSNQSVFKTVDFLAFANEEVAMGILPLILSMNEEYYVYSTLVPIVGGQSRYPIPGRAVGGKLRDLFYQDEQGNLKKLSRLSPELKSQFQTQGGFNGFELFYLEGNDIVLTPAVPASVTGSLLMSYYLRPNDLVDVSQAAIIRSITTDGNGNTVFTVDQIPSGMSTATPLDINQSTPGFKIWNFDLIPSSINTLNLQISIPSSSIQTGISVGDHICFAGECIIPQLPEDLHSILAQRVTARCLEAQGDAAGLQAANAKLQELEQKSTVLIDNRVDGAPRKVFTGGGMIRASKVRRGWGF